MDQFFERTRPHFLAVYRVVIGLLFMAHGIATLFGSICAKTGCRPVPEFAAWPGWWAAAIQLVGGALIILGLGSRIAAIISSGSMAYAYFVYHQGDGLWPIQNGGVPAALFCWALLIIAFVGPGSFALGDLIGGRKSSDEPKQSVTV